MTTIRMGPFKEPTTNLQHVPDSGAERVINETEVQMASTFNKCRYSRIVCPKREDALSQIPKGWV